MFLPFPLSTLRMIAIVYFCFFCIFLLNIMQWNQQKSNFTYYSNFGTWFRLRNSIPVGDHKQKQFSFSIPNQTSVQYVTIFTIVEQSCGKISAMNVNFYLFHNHVITWNGFSIDRFSVYRLIVKIGKYVQLYLSLILIYWTKYR